MYPNHVRNVSKLCPKCIQIMFKMYPNYVQYVFKSCPLCTIRYRNMYSLKIRPLYFVIFWINNRFVRWGKSLEKYAIYANIYRVLFPLETKQCTQKKVVFFAEKNCYLQSFAKLTLTARSVFALMSGSPIIMQTFSCSQWENKDTFVSLMAAWHAKSFQNFKLELIGHVINSFSECNSMKKF